jgi:hypothetical protein
VEEATLARCFQLMEAKDDRLLHEWAENWVDLVEFEIIPVVTSGEAAARVSASS